MDKVKGAREALDRAINGYVRRFDTYRAVDNRQGNRARGIQRWRVDKAIRELMLAVHVENCEVAGMIVGESDVTKDCGDGWDCERAKALKELAKEA